ncbi:hypothetical protein VKT23_007843 [Stygiomarasmius scandens]|uniref:C2H2-type domain-containing protein n=1 Tax=Marasmiellus scandens TaxID=2682957 RepID=A0ABR1JL92_9AGAR
MPAMSSTQPQPLLCQECQPPKKFSKYSNLTRHKNTYHTNSSSQDGPTLRFIYVKHPKLNGMAICTVLEKLAYGQIGLPCDESGAFLPPHAPPAPEPPIPPAHSKESWAPFSEHVEFEFAHYHFVEQHTSRQGINRALDIWAASLLRHGIRDGTPWKSVDHLYSAIDSIREGHIAWKTYTVKYEGPLPPGTPPKWMTQEFELCVRDAREVVHEQLGTKEFNGKVHYTPYMQFENGEHRFSNLMSGDWAHGKANIIAEDKDTWGSMLVPIVLGSDKTTVSVATGSQEFHPGYISIGNITNVARHAHGKGVLPFAFLPIPKTNKKQRKKVAYQCFCRQMYHACLSMALQPLKPGMTSYEVVKCPDDHFRRAIYEIGPYIADYPEQVLLAGIVQNWCPKCFAKPDNLDSPDPLLLRS